MKKTLYLLLALIVILAMTTGCEAERPLIDSSMEDVSDSFENYETDKDRISQRNISFAEEGHFFVRRIDYKDGNGLYESSYRIPGTSGELTYFVDGVMETSQLEPGYLPLDTILIIDTDKHSTIISQAYSYRELGRGTKEANQEVRPIEIKQEADYYTITYRFAREEAQHGVMWAVASSSRLIEWTDLNQRIWTNYDLNRNDRLCEDGYYYQSPSNYEPSTESSYWRNPAMYIVNSFVRTGGSLAADLLGRAYLLIALDNLEEPAYFPTLPESGWLKEDYGIGPRFFDTRFNADIMEVYLEGYKKFGYSKYREAYLKMADYYLEHVEQNHYKIKGQQEGYLVEDYNYRGNSHKSHSSLNHQIHAAKVFLKVYQEEEDERYQQVAKKMLYGVKNTRDMWVKDDYNLHYSYAADGSMGMADYPYLTYNDLYFFRDVHYEVYGYDDEDIEFLMDAKMKWMKANNVSGYVAYPRK